MDPGVSEADDVRPTIARQVGEEAWVSFDPPGSSLVTEAVDDPLQALEGAVAVASCDVDPAVSEADDVRPTIARQVGEEARVSFDPPVSSLVTKGVFEEHPWCGEQITHNVVAVAKGVMIEHVRWPYVIPRLPRVTPRLHEIVKVMTRMGS